jgi:hypothetical protein
LTSSRPLLAQPLLSMGVLVFTESPVARYCVEFILIFLRFAEGVHQSKAPSIVRHGSCKMLRVNN